MAINTLQKRLSLLVMLPTALVLLFIGVFGFVYMRGALFTEWQEASIVKVQRAAHQIDMKLGAHHGLASDVPSHLRRQGRAAHTGMDTQAVTGHERG